MRRTSTIVLALGLICLSLQAGDKKAPPGMEIISIGNVDYVVPEGTKVKKKDGIISVEGRSEYTARRFSEVEERIFALEEKNRTLENKFENLKKLIDNKDTNKPVEESQEVQQD
ncbi:MAG: hypothetical protein K9L71_03160 [Candidatus Omnitrophica bacterium]|nr:hypothetical protein [Candidatus Omnitrophota bacterium]